MNPPDPPPPATVADAIADALVAARVRRVFTVPGESFLPILDALDSRGVAVTACRQEGGAAFMAQAHGRLTGGLGVCLASRAPGASNAAIGVHEASQAGTPLLLVVGQVPSASLGRRAFQEVDLAAMFAPLAKAVVTVADEVGAAAAAQRAVEVATSGRPGPVVLVVPVDVASRALAASEGTAGPNPTESAPDDVASRPLAVTEAAVAPIPTGSAEDAASRALAQSEGTAGPIPTGSAADDAARAATWLGALLSTVERPIVVAGGGGWSAEAAENLRRWAEAWHLPVAADFRCQDYLDNRSPSYVGDLAIAPDPRLVARFADADLVIALGSELGDIATQGYRMLADRAEGSRIVQVHVDPRPVVAGSPVEVSRVDPLLVLAELATAAGPAETPRWKQWTGEARADWEAWTAVNAAQAGDHALIAETVRQLSALAPDDAVVCVGAGNYTAWVQRYWTFREYGTQLAPRSGSMGYGLPAAIAAGLEGADRPVVAFAGDGCFLMTGQELATAAQYGVGLTCVVVDNGMYGTIRMHQERVFPGRVVGTTLVNPDFVQLAESFGGWARLVETADEAAAAFADCLAHPGRLSVIHLRTDPSSISPNWRLADGGGLEPVPGGAT